MAVPLSQPIGLTRRRLLARSLQIAAAATASPWMPETGRAFQLGEHSFQWLDLGARPDVSSGTKFYDLSRAESWLTPVEDFFVLQHHGVPRIGASSWSLSFDGLFGTPRPLSLEELRSRETVEMPVCIECAGNGSFGMHGLVGNARFRGVRLAPLLQELGLESSARELVFVGADAAHERLRGKSYPSRFARSLSVPDAMHPDVLLAFEMNGEPLTQEHGYPLRLIVPGWYGVAQVKWLNQIRAIDKRFMGWYMAKDYVTVKGVSIDGEVQHRAHSVGRALAKSIVTRVSSTESSFGPSEPDEKSETPEDDEGFVSIHGIAWGDGSPIRSIEVAVDDEPFRRAMIEPPTTDYGWKFFNMRWPRLSAGEHTIVSRVTDARGVQPTEEEAARFKATPWENNGQIRRRLRIDEDDGNLV